MCCRSCTERLRRGLLLQLQRRVSLTFSSSEMFKWLFVFDDAKLLPDIHESIISIMFQKSPLHMALLSCNVATYASLNFLNSLEFVKGIGSAESNSVTNTILSSIFTENTPSRFLVKL